MQTSLIDWFRIIADLRNIAGMTQVDVADEIKVPRSRVRDWATKGTTPRFDDGALLVLLWLKKTQKTQVQSNSVSEQMETACLSVRCLSLPRKGR